MHRSLPFFGTALGIVVGALAYAAGRLPRWSDPMTLREEAGFLLASLLLVLATFESGCVLVWLARAIARREYQRIGPEAALRDRQAELRAYYEAQGIVGAEQDHELVNDLRQALLESYAAVTPLNREMNRRRYRFRAVASSHLVRSLIWALAATSVIFVTDKLGYFPRGTP